MLLNNNTTSENHCKLAQEWHGMRPFPDMLSINNIFKIYRWTLTKETFSQEPVEVQKVYPDKTSKPLSMNVKQVLEKSSQ